MFNLEATHPVTLTLPILSCFLPSLATAVTLTISGWYVFFKSAVTAVSYVVGTNTVNVFLLR